MWMSSWPLWGKSPCACAPGGCWPGRRSVPCRQKSKGAQLLSSRCGSLQVPSVVNWAPRSAIFCRKTVHVQLKSLFSLANKTRKKLRKYIKDRTSHLIATFREMWKLSRFWFWAKILIEVDQKQTRDFKYYLGKHCKKICNWCNWWQ